VIFRTMFNRCSLAGICAIDANIFSLYHDESKASPPVQFRDEKQCFEQARYEFFLKELTKAFAMFLFFAMVIPLK
jgi:hypothetical protein